MPTGHALSSVYPAEAPKAKDVRLSQASTDYPATKSADDNLFLRSHDLADHIGILSVGLEDLNGLVHLSSRHHNAHANAHVEGVVHIPLADVAGLGDGIEDGQHLDGSLIDLGAQTIGDGARNVLVEAATGDVADALDLDLLVQGQHSLHIDAGGP